MKIKHLLLLAGIASIGLTSCDKTISQELEITIPIGGEKKVYVLTEGQSYSGIEGGLNVLNLSLQTVSKNVFKTVNGRSLGSTPQCGVAYGSRIYIGTSESNTIEIIDRETYKSIKQINVADVTSEGMPYSMLAHDGKVFISMFGGCLARLDTLSLSIDKTVHVGNNPDQIALFNNKIFVPISDGMNYPVYGKTAVTVDPKTMTVETTFETGVNPRNFEVVGNHLFILCMGNYGDVPSVCYEVKQANGTYKLDKVCNATMIASYGSYLAIINQPFVEEGTDPVLEYRLYNPASGSLKDWNIECPDYANAMFYDKDSDCIMIASYVMNGKYPSYELPGYVNVYKNDNLRATQKYELGAAGRAWFFTLQK